jgi:hypothetical protein
MLSKITINTSDLTALAENGVTINHIKQEDSIIELEISIPHQESAYQQVIMNGYNNISPIG